MSDDLGILRRRHAEYYLDLAEQHAPRLFGGASDVELMPRLSVETPNMRAVADWAAQDTANSEVSLRLGWALHLFWFASSQFEEMRLFLTSALECDTPQNPLWRTRALVALGHVLIWQVKGAKVRPEMQEAIDLAQQLGDDEVICSAMIGIGAG